MIVRTITAGTVLVAASLFVAAPVAQADTGSADSASSSINIGCLIQSLQGIPPTADCNPPSIPAQ
ncbi:hypothetical protein AB0G00_29720 [Nocardia salmonicida]|uniref:hypothetical protein n=1 Tax=Nocardia TaxID=1817 RepID=UPI00265878D7|nr:hypothetical protein [Nocardia sp. PE-7]WKG11221.1 hypothetical protein QX204_07065 [Nocardia sp. PE-7]